MPSYCHTAFASVSLSGHYPILRFSYQVFLMPLSARVKDVRENPVVRLCPLNAPTMKANMILAHYNQKFPSYAAHQGSCHFHCIRINHAMQQDAKEIKKKVNQQ